MKNQINVLAVIIDVSSKLENSPVFQSQVGEQLIALRSIGLKVGLLAVCRDNATFEKVIGQRLRDAGVEIFLVQESHFLLNICLMARLLRQIGNRIDIRFAYVRGLWGPLVLALANPLKRIQYVYDIRGSIADESLAVGTSLIKRKIYSTLELWGVRGASSVSAVTRYLGDGVLRRHYKGKVYVIPSNVNAEDFFIPANQYEARQQRLGFKPSDIVLVYSGGLNHYQQIPETIALWKRLLDEPDLKFLFLTNVSPHTRPKVAGDLSVFGSRLHCQSLSREEILSTLGAATIGFMLRDSRELNQAASPVKFAEYVAAGLAVVASPGTGDVSDLISEHDIGVLVDPANLDDGEIQVRKLIQAVRNDRPAFRARSRNLALTKYDWKAYQGVYQEIYGVQQ